MQHGYGRVGLEDRTDQRLRLEMGSGSQGQGFDTPRSAMAAAPANERLGSLTVTQATAGCTMLGRLNSYPARGIIGGA